MAGTKTVGRSVAILGLVLAITAGGVKLIDRVGRALAEPDRVDYASVADLERAAGARLGLPGYFPESLAWPPLSVVGVGGRRSKAAVLAVGRRDARDGPCLYLAETLRGDTLPEGLLPPGAMLEDELVTVAGAPGRLRRIVAPDGGSWRELRWRSDGREYAVRSLGSVLELVRIAESFHREGP